ncbi:spore germination protein [Alicyclobacillus tolerans]|uniref:spore germination protein n=1 Tax=Alicyclobacillus tolerans TaxID=90970 RepID=UPI001F1844FA|nr:spore germination protein [Alicyclobacillus tolerans]MCF8564295.1 spore germination protein [Alicyclobacillus tolerans]
MSILRRRSPRPRYVKEAVRHGLREEYVYDQAPLSRRLSDNIDALKQIFARSADVVFYPFTLFDNRDGCLIYIEGLVDSKHIASDLLRPLTRARVTKLQYPTRKLSVRQLVHAYVTIPEGESASTLGQVVKYIMEQYVILVVEGEDEAAALSAVSRRDRSIQEPDTESVIRGPREGFNENIGTSISLVRRRLPTPDFKTENMQIGLYTKTDVVLCYVQGLADPEVLQEARERLGRIQMDGVIDSGYLEEMIEDNPYSPFPQIQNTERPDVVAASLLEGKFAILMDGSPFALVAPVNLWSALQAAEDYYERYMIVTLLRFLRYMFLNFALFLPSLYVAITTFHQEMLPTKLLFSVAAAREATPLPAVMEALIMELSFEALREAGVRLPKAVGSAISIVGALVIGQAAVAAGMASAPMVIIVALTGISSFVIPRYNFAISIRMLRFPLIVLAGSLGLFGLVMGLIAIAIHLCSLRSFGRPYLSPVSPLDGAGIMDTFIRAPRWAMEKRPVEISKANRRRQTDSTRPRRRLPRLRQT